MTTGPWHNCDKVTEIACPLPTKWGVFIGLEKYKRNIQKIQKIIKPSHKSIITMIVLVVIENSMPPCLFSIISY